MNKANVHFGISVLKVMLTFYCLAFLTGCDDSNSLQTTSTSPYVEQVGTLSLTRHTPSHYDNNQPADVSWTVHLKEVGKPSMELATITEHFDEDPYGHPDYYLLPGVQGTVRFNSSNSSDYSYILSINMGGYRFVTTALFFGTTRDMPQQARTYVDYPYYDEEGHARRWERGMTPFGYTNFRTNHGEMQYTWLSWVQFTPAPMPDVNYTYARYYDPIAYPPMLVGDTYVVQPKAQTNGDIELRWFDHHGNFLRSESPGRMYYDENLSFLPAAIAGTPEHYWLLKGDEMSLYEASNDRFSSIRYRTGYPARLYQVGTSPIFHYYDPRDDTWKIEYLDTGEVEVAPPPPDVDFEDTYCYIWRP